MLWVLLMAQAAASYNGPAYLVLSNEKDVKMIPYKTMTACLRAKRIAEAGDQPTSRELGKGAVIFSGPEFRYTCVPRE